MKKLTKLSAISLTVALSVSGALPGLNTTIQAHATSYGGYTTTQPTQPTYHTVTSYYITHAQAVSLASSLKIYSNAKTTVLSVALATVLGKINKGFPGRQAFISSAALANTLAMTAQGQDEVMTAASTKHPTWRVLVKIQDANVHTSYSIRTVFTAVP